MTFEEWWRKNTSGMHVPNSEKLIAEAAWQTAQAEQAIIISNQIEMITRLRDERDTLLKDIGVLVDDDFGSQCWTMSLDRAAMRLKKLVVKLRKDYDA